MSKVTCSVCHASLDSRMMSVCGECHSYMCQKCGAQFGDHCPECAEDGGE